MQFPAIKKERRSHNEMSTLPGTVFFTIQKLLIFCEGLNVKAKDPQRE